MGCDRDQAGRLIREARIELTTWINKLLQLPILPDLQLCRQNLYVWIGSIDIAKIDQIITRNIHFLTRPEYCVLLNLEEVRTYDAQCQHYQSQVHQVTTITLAVAIEEHIQGKQVRLSMTMAHAYPTPQFIKYSACCKSTDGE